MPKKKPKPLSKGVLVRAKARATIGQPKATQVHQTFKPKTKRGYRQHEINDYTSLAVLGANFFNLSTPNPIIEGAPVLAQRGDPSQIPANVSVKMQQPKIYSKPIPGIHYSPEVIEHCNFLRKTKGQLAVEQYLSTLRSTEIMSTTHLGILEALRDAKDKEKKDAETEFAGGGIEAALNDATRKQRYFQAEVERNQQEATKYQNVINALQLALDLATGKKKHVAPVSNEVVGGTSEVIPRPGRVGMKIRGKGYWIKRVPEALLEFGKGNKKSVFIRYLAEKDESTVGAVDQAVRKCKEEGLIVEIDGLLVHPDWTT